MSHARGRWQRIERVAEAMPWLRYMATLDDRTRPAHRAWHGTVLRHDHPFWRSHYPPNGWHCRCTVLQFSDADLERYGLTPGEGPPPGSDKTRQWINKRTGRPAETAAEFRKRPDYRLAKNLLRRRLPQRRGCGVVVSSIASCGVVRRSCPGAGARWSTT